MIRCSPVRSAEAPTRRARSFVAVLSLAAFVAAAACQQSSPLPAASSPKPADAAVAAAAPPPAPAAPATPPAIPKDVQVGSGAHGLVATEEERATHVGVAVLEAGGNAVDAAVATAFALAVTHPVAGNIGGGGFAVVRLADGKVVALDFRETAPGAASADMYIDKKPPPRVAGHGAPFPPPAPAAKPPMPGASLVGHRASGVPGSVAGLWALHKKYGTKPWADLLAPAIALARDGFEVTPQFAKSVADSATTFAMFPGSAALFLPAGVAPAAGSTWKAPDLADTLERIAKQGPEDFYTGKTADLLVAEMKRGGGLISKKDLAGYKVEWREPIAFDYRGYHIYSMPPPSSGGVVLAMLAQMLGGDDLHALGWHSAQAVHLVAEAIRRAYAARNEFLADPRFMKLPIATLLAPEHAAALRKTIDPARATPSKETPLLVEGVHTTHFAVVDAQGGMVALTYTLNAAYGSRVVVTGAGFLMNDEMDDFATQPGVPNAYGLVQGAINKIAPGKRMLSSMSPTIVVDAKGQPFAAFGAQGGSRIITAVWQVMSNVIDYGMDVGEAVGARRFHHQHIPDAIFVEAGALTPEVEKTLAGYGHKLLPAQGPLGVAPAIVRKGDSWTGAADPRKNGLALGY
jgi:gamma-glutamyltranspeptidase/glutathione hydrolase